MRVIAQVPHYPSNTSITRLFRQMKRRNFRCGPILRRIFPLFPLFLRYPREYICQHLYIRRRRLRRSLLSYSSRSSLCVLTTGRTQEGVHLIGFFLRNAETGDVEPVVAAVAADHKAAFVFRLQTTTYTVSLGFLHRLQQLPFLRIQLDFPSGLQGRTFVVEVFVQRTGSFATAASERHT